MQFRCSLQQAEASSPDQLIKLAAARRESPCEEFSATGQILGPAGFRGSCGV
jgi:hypothetical protein